MGQTTCRQSGGGRPSQRAGRVEGGARFPQSPGRGSWVRPCGKPSHRGIAEEQRDDDGHARDQDAAGDLPGFGGLHAVGHDGQGDGIAGDEPVGDVGEDEQVDADEGWQPAIGTAGVGRDARTNRDTRLGGAERATVRRWAVGMVSGNASEAGCEQGAVRI